MSTVAPPLVEASSEDAFAVLLTPMAGAVEAATWKFTVNCFESPAARWANVQLTDCDGAPHVYDPAVIESTINRASTESVTTRLSASDVPALCTVTVNDDPAPPAVTVGDVNVLVTERTTFSAMSTVSLPGV